MAIKYEYSSPCCGHFYVETRNPGDNQVVTKCNLCGQGEYELTAQTELEETIPTVSE
jgi:hypothetical protein